jgi:glycerol-3-phosphate dehydrogenase (NAD(P)+)
MGTALVTPLASNGHEVVLWGTERDGEIVAALQAGKAHPRLRVALPPDVAIRAASGAADALRGAEIVVVAITSDAVRPVLRGLAPHLGAPRSLVTVAKGFDAGRDGMGVEILPETLGEFSSAPVVAVGGPAKANEVAHGQPTAVVFGSRYPGALAFVRSTFQTPVYRIESTDDLDGLEMCAAMKNAFAIALGIPDGLEQRTGKPHHNLRAALFPRAVAEMGMLASLYAGRAETAYGLAGAGDLLVTITSGRNRLLGERIGLGERADEAVQALTGQGTTIEGFPAVAFGRRLYREAVTTGRIAEGSMPLLDATWRILYQNEPAESALVALL